MNKEQLKKYFQKIWAKIYFSNDKFKEYSLKASDFLYDIDSEYFNGYINDLCDELFGEGLYRFSSRLLINETKQAYDRYNWDDENILYHKKKRSDDYDLDDSLTIRLSYSIPIKEAIKLGRFFIKRYYDIVCQCITEYFKNKSIKCIKLYKFQTWGENDKDREYDKDFIKYINSPCVLIDISQPKLNQIINLFNFYISDETEIHYNTDMYSIYQYNTSSNVFLNKCLMGYINKISFDNLLRNIFAEVIYENNEKNLYIIDYTVNEIDDKISNCNRFFAPFLYKAIIDDSNSNIAINAYQFDLYTYRVSDCMNLYNCIFDVRKKFDDKINGLLYKNCESFEDMFIELKYYLGEEYCINILPIHSKTYERNI